MSGRTDRLLENDLLQRVLRARKWFQELRTNVQRFGSQSVKTYRIFSNSTYDIEVLNIGFNNRVIELVFTPASVDPGLGGVFNLEAVFTFDSTSQSVSVIKEDLLPENGISKWRFYLSSSDFYPAPYTRMKFYIFANASGTFTATLL